MDEKFAPLYTGQRVFIDGSLAIVTRFNPARPHVVFVIYQESRAGAWVHRRRVQMVRTLARGR